MRIGSLLRFLCFFCNLKLLIRLLQDLKRYSEDCVLPQLKLERGAGTFIHPSVSISNPHNIKVGISVRIQMSSILWASDNARISVGNYSGLGPGVKVYTSNHKFGAGARYIDQPWEESDVTIGDNVWVGSGTVLLAGVRIGDNSVIAAGSVVNKDIPSDCLAAGVPCRVVRGVT